jgi:hypothetical protein
MVLLEQLDLKEELVLLAQQDSQDHREELVPLEVLVYKDVMALLEPLVGQALTAELVQPVKLATLVYQDPRVSQELLEIQEGMVLKEDLVLLAHRDEQGRLELQD